MKKHRHFYRLSLLTATLLPLVTGCVTDQDFRGLQMQIRSMDNRLVEMERSLDELERGAGTSVKIMQKQQANMGGTLDRVNTELLQVKGQLDETRHRYRSLQSENKRLEGELSQIQAKSEAQALELKERLGSVETSASELDNRLANVHSNLTAVQEKQAREAAARAEAARKAAEQARLKVTRSTAIHEIFPEKTKKSPGLTSQSSVSPSPASPIKSSGQKKYDRALELFRAKKYQQSQDLFNQFIKENPTTDLAINARFWVGDCLYNQKEYALAILEYQNVIADFPHYRKAPAALFKQGLSFEKLQDTDTSVIVYKKVLSEYPKSDQAAAAKKRLKALGK